MQNANGIDSISTRCINSNPCNSKIFSSLLWCVGIIVGVGILYAQVCPQDVPLFDPPLPDYLLYLLAALGGFLSVASLVQLVRLVCSEGPPVQAREKAAPKLDESARGSVPFLDQPVAIYQNNNPDNDTTIMRSSFSAGLSVSSDISTSPMSSSSVARSGSSSSSSQSPNPLKSDVAFGANSSAINSAVCDTTIVTAPSSTTLSTSSSISTNSVSSSSRSQSSSFLPSTSSAINSAVCDTAIITALSSTTLSTSSSISTNSVSSSSRSHSSFCLRSTLITHFRSLPLSLKIHVLSFLSVTEHAQLYRSFPSVLPRSYKNNVYPCIKFNRHNARELILIYGKVLGKLTPSQVTTTSTGKRIEEFSLSRVLQDENSLLYCLQIDRDSAVYVRWDFSDFDSHSFCNLFSHNIGLTILENNIDYIPCSDEFYNSTFNGLYDLTPQSLTTSALSLKKRAVLIKTYVHLIKDKPDFLVGSGDSLTYSPKMYERIKRFVSYYPDITFLMDVFSNENRRAGNCFKKVLEELKRNDLEVSIAVLKVDLEAATKKIEAQVNKITLFKKLEVSDAIGGVTD